jgi:putative DNA primase/helicase
MPVSFRPTHKLWLFGNDKPVIKGTDTGIWRRIMLIPFNHSFPEEGQQGWRDKEEVLKELRAELPGILNWAIDGYREYKSQGLNPPEAVLNAVKQYRSESDVLNEFIDDHFDLNTDGIITRSELWEQYMKYTKDDDRKQFKSRGALYKAMASRDFKECKSMGIRGFTGLKLKREGS